MSGTAQTGGTGTDPTAPEETETAAGAPLSLGTPTPGTSVGERVGRFVVLEEIGRGNMGRVLRAYDDTLRREVALKEVLTDSLGAHGSEQLVAEARAMARLSHPNVVAVYDVEETLDAGSPRRKVVVVMEYVAGTTLRAWQRAEERAWPQILARYIDAGGGLAAAHAAGLLHRDFKPANVLIAEDARDGAVKVTDFGLAKLGPEPSPEGPHRSTVQDAPTVTLDGAISGTPRYMAPEQHRGDVLDAAADQYALCVSLWEALCGEPPFVGPDLAAAKEDGPPPWPGGPVPGRIVDALRRGLSPDPRARWPSVDELLDALRYDPTRRRIWWGLAAVGVTVTVLGVGQWQSWVSAQAQQCSGARDVIDEVWGDRRASVKQAMLAVGGPLAEGAWNRSSASLDEYSEQWAAEHEEACAATTLRGEQSSRVMDLRMRCLGRAKIELSAAVDALAGADVDVVRNARELVGELPNLDHCADLEQLESDLPQPAPEEASDVQAIRVQLAGVRAQLRAGHVQKARDMLEDVRVAWADLEYGPLQGEIALVEGKALEAFGEYDPAETRLREALRSGLAWRQLGLARDAAIELIDLVGSRKHQPEAGLRYRDLAEGLATEDPLVRADIATSVGLVRGAQGRYREALEKHRLALSLRRGALGSDHPSLASSITAVANAMQALGDFAGGETELRKALRSYEQALGRDHPDVGSAHSNIGNNYERQGRYEEAEAEHRKALHILENALGPRHVDVAQARGNRAVALHALGQLDEAETEFRASLEVQQTALGPEHRLTLNSRSNLAANLKAQGKFPEAEAELRQVLARRLEKLGPAHPDVGDSYNNLANAVLAQGRATEAEALYRQAIDVWVAALGPAHPDVVTAQTNLAHSLTSRDAYDEARSLAELAWANAQRDDIEPRITGDAAIVLAFALWEGDGRPKARERAVELATVALDRYRRGGPAEVGNAAQVEATLKRWAEDAR